MKRIDRKKYLYTHKAHCDRTKWSYLSSTKEMTVYRGLGDNSPHVTLSTTEDRYTNEHRKSRVLTGWRGGKDCLYTS